MASPAEHVRYSTDLSASLCPINVMQYLKTSDDFSQLPGETSSSAVRYRLPSRARNCIHNVSKLAVNAGDVMRHEELLASTRSRILSHKGAPYKVACLVDKSSKPPPHLYGYFSSMHRALIMDKIRDEAKLSRAQLLKRTAVIDRCASSLLADFQDDRVRQALVCGPFSPLDVLELCAKLNDLRTRVANIQKDRLLTTSNGKARSGSGAVPYPWPCSMKLWIAILIVAAMEHQHGELPKPRNTRACDAAEQLWLSVGGHPSGREHAHNAWRAHIKEARQDRWAENRKSICWHIAFRKQIMDLRNAS